MADVFRRHGEAWRAANAGHVSLAQRRVMSAIEACRTAALGGHVERCEDCAHTRIAYNSCRNRHCPKCQWSAAAGWLAAREAELLPVPYFHVVFTLPAQIGAIAYQNKAKVYGLLFKAAAETLTTIAADPKHLGAEIGLTAVLHTWGQNLDHHPHVHCIVPGGGISPDGERWVACRPDFFLPVRVLSRLFRRLFLRMSRRGIRCRRAAVLRRSRELEESDGVQARISRRCARANGWSMPSVHSLARAGARLSCALHSSRRHRQQSARSLCPTATSAFAGRTIARTRKSKVMTLAAGEFMRRFLMHVLPDGFHRIRHYGLFANGHRADKVNFVESCSTCHPVTTVRNDCDEGDPARCRKPAPCPCCGGRMKIIETFDGRLSGRSRHARRFDSS